MSGEKFIQVQVYKSIHMTIAIIAWIDCRKTEELLTFSFKQIDETSEERCTPARIFWGGLWTIRACRSIGAKAGPGSLSIMWCAYNQYPPLSGGWTFSAVQVIFLTHNTVVFHPTNGMMWMCKDKVMRGVGCHWATTRLTSRDRAFSEELVHPDDCFL